MERNNHTERALKDLEQTIESLLILEGFIKEERRHGAYQSLSQSKLERRYDAPAGERVITNEYDMPTKRAPEMTSIKKSLASPLTVRGVKDLNSSNTLREAAKHLLTNNSFVHQSNGEDTGR